MTEIRKLMDPVFAALTSQGSTFDTNASVDMKKVTMMCWADPFRPDDSVPEHIKKATIDCINSVGAHYTFPVGDNGLRQEIAKRVKKLNGLDVDAQKNIIICCGSDTAFIFSMRPFLVPGERNEVMIPTPSYANNYTTPELAGGVVVTVPTYEEDGYQLHIEEFEKRLTSKTKMILITNPNNPTSTVYSHECLQQLADFVIKNNLILLVDQCFEDTVFDGYQMTNISALPGMFERTILMSSLSKGMGLCGYRIGYVVTSDDICDVLQSCTVDFLGAPNTAAQAGVLAGLRDTAFMEEYRQEYMARAKEISAILDTIPYITYNTPQSSFFFWINVSAYGTCSEVTKYLIREALIMPSQGSSFGNDKCIRLIYAVLKDRKECINAVLRMKDALLRHPVNQK